jgi:hypothetical protein
MIPEERMKGECSQCGGHIEFPGDLFGTEIECPHCHAQTLLSGTEEKTAVPPQIAQQTSLAAPHQETLKGRGPFYSGCMGTLGVFTALVLLALIGVAVLAFFVGAPAFFRARELAQKAATTSQTDQRVRVAPPSLNDEEKAYIERLFARGKLKEEHDAIENRFSVRGSEMDYYGQGSLQIPWLRLSYTRIGERGRPVLWFVVSHDRPLPMSMERAKCNVDGRLWELELSNAIQKENAFGARETAAFSAMKERELVNALLFSTGHVTIRLEGNHQMDQVLPTQSIRMMQDVFLAYRYHGGEW